jgi:hypothetical protein
MEHDTYRVLEGKIVLVESRHEFFYAIKLTPEEEQMALALMRARLMHVYYLDDGTPAVILATYPIS